MLKNIKNIWPGELISKIVKSKFFMLKISVGLWANSSGSSQSS